MRKALIFGANAREVVFANRLIDENVKVYIMAKKKPPELRSEICFLEHYIDMELCIKIAPDIIFAFGDDYIYNEGFNDRIHEVFKEKLVVIPNKKFWYYEKNKESFRNFFEEEYLTPISGNELIEKCKKSKCFVEISYNDLKEYRIFEKNTEVLGKIEEKQHYRCEEYHEGTNITITILKLKNKIIVFPEVMDYPFIRKNDVLIKTGGVRCDYRKGLLSGKIKKEIVDKIMDYISDEYVGFIAVQTIISGEKIFLVEVDIRPGEPEFINVINMIGRNIKIFDLMFDEEKFVIIEGKRVLSQSHAIASSDYPQKNSVCINNFFRGKPYQIFYSKATESEGELKNYDNGRLCFLYIEGKDENEIIKSLYLFIKDNKKNLLRGKLKIY